MIGSTAEDLRFFFQDGLQISELVIVNDAAVYSFSAVDSGVFLEDGVNSYSATYVQTTKAVPEPEFIEPMILTPIIILRRRNR